MVVWAMKNCNDVHKAGGKLYVCHLDKGHANKHEFTIDWENMDD